MANANDAQQIILDRILSIAPNATSEGQAAAVRNLAEAWAWLANPSQPHGGSGTVKTG